MSATTLIIDHTGHYANLTSNRQTEGLKRFTKLQTVDQKSWYLGAIDSAYAVERTPVSARLTNGLGPRELVFQSSVGTYSASQLNGGFLVESLPRLLKQLKPDTIEVYSVIKIGVEILRVARNSCPTAKLQVYVHDGELLCPLNGIFINSDGVQCQSPSPRACSNCTKILSAPDVFYRAQFIQGHLGFADEIVLYPGAYLNRLQPWLDKEYKGRLILADDVAPEVNVTEQNRLKSFAFFGSADDENALQLLKRALKLVSSSVSSSSISIDIFPTDRHIMWPDKLVEELEQANIQVQSKWTPHFFERYMESYGWVILPSSPSAESVRFVELARKAGLGLIADDSYAGGDVKYAPHSAASLARAVTTLWNT